MNFKKPKSEVIQDATKAAFSAIDNHMYNIQSGPINSIGNSVANMMKFAIDAAVVSLVNNVYTDEEFEKDLNLRT